jgi:hypothetical protein
VYRSPLAAVATGEPSDTASATSKQLAETADIEVGMGSLPFSLWDRPLVD